MGAPIFCRWDFFFNYISLCNHVYISIFQENAQKLVKSCFINLKWYVSTEINKILQYWSEKVVDLHQISFGISCYCATYLIFEKVGSIVTIIDIAGQTITLVELSGLACFGVVKLQYPHAHVAVEMEVSVTWE